MHQYFNTKFRTKTVISEGDIDKKSQTLNYEVELLLIISVTGLDLNNATA